MDDNHPRVAIIADRQRFCWRAAASARAGTRDRGRVMRDFPPLAALAISLVFLGLLLVWAQDLGIWQCDWCIRRIK